MSIGNYKIVYDEYGNSSSIEVGMRGADVQRNLYIGRTSAFTAEERDILKLNALLPPAIRTMEQQVKNSSKVLQNKNSDIEKFIYLRSLFDRNVTLAHAVIASNIAETMGIIYTPTVGLACRNYSSMFRIAYGLHFYPGNIDSAEEILRDYSHDDIRVAVVTDNQGILGIGDQGAGGIAICLGKLMLYTQGAGIAPWHCLPISLDVGTDNKDLLEADNYLGWRHPRLEGDEYVEFVQKFARAFRAVYPNALCQWEDFSKQNAFAIRDSYLHDLISFNDDIQGTGAITLSAIIAAMKIKQEKLKDQVYLIHGAGAGGVGIADQLESALIDEGLTALEAQERIYTLDSRGLTTTDRRLDQYKERFAKDPQKLGWYNGPDDGSLINVIKYGKVGVLIGTSGQAGCFTEQVVKEVHNNSNRPVILPLSNPTTYAEASPEDIYNWTNNQALVATGSPFEPVKVNGKDIRVGQCNNVFIFPGVGLGTLASGAREVKPQFFNAAARAVAEMVPESDLNDGVLLPPIPSLREVSYQVACAVGRQAISQQVSGKCVYSNFQHDNDPNRLDKLIDLMRWIPRYLPLKAV